MAPPFRLLTLSQRNGSWTALVDPGNGGAVERLHTGDAFNGWQVRHVDGQGVELVAGTQTHSLRLLP